MSIPDARQRETALDPTRSFCVSAPAGSGKTELLIQRYLGLLSRVTRPEQVLAITFTRKAAAEMRGRVLEALEAARDEEPITSPHQRTTRNLAERALAADAAGDWQLLRDVSRLNIKTIDSFCASLTRQMPVLSQFGGQAAVTDQAEPLYEEAVGELFGILETGHTLAADLRVLLSHFDNNWQRVQDLLVSMLQRRAQWGEYIGVRHRPEQAEYYLLQTVRNLVREDLELLGNAMDTASAEILELQHYAADQLDTTRLPRFPQCDPDDVAHWRTVKDLLLTRQGAWRRAVDKRAGFPAGNSEEKQRKQQLLGLVDSLREQD